TTSGIQTIYPGTPSADPQNLVEQDGYLYFSAFSEFEGRELWTVTPKGQVRMVDFDPDTRGIQTFAPGAHDQSFYRTFIGNSDSMWIEVGGEVFFAPWVSSFDLTPITTSSSAWPSQITSGQGGTSDSRSGKAAAASGVRPATVHGGPNYAGSLWPRRPSVVRKA
ncbi:hypothetical protein, partial [Pseudooceanicola sp.]|uniref:hypothetical protein n=1 Tax=Pseudooceanicola sp. TaxID=1914328 RepID=UPI003513A330